MIYLSRNTRLASIKGNHHRIALAKKLIDDYYNRRINTSNGGLDKGVEYFITDGHNYHIESFLDRFPEPDELVFKVDIEKWGKNGFRFGYILLNRN
jgi:uncharacterized protein (UPF0128 family)